VCILNTESANACICIAGAKADEEEKISFVRCLMKHVMLIHKGRVNSADYLPWQSLVLVCVTISTVQYCINEVFNVMAHIYN